MTEIRRSIEIAATNDRVWECINPQNWQNIFHFVKKVDGYEQGKSGVRPHASVIAGGDDSAIRYNVEVTELSEKTKIVYRRYGGPLVGKGVIQLKPLQKGTLLKRTNIYNDDLSEETIQSLSEGMEKDNLRVKKVAETPK